MATTLRDLNRERTHEDILRAAIEAFNESGYRATTMSHIAHRAKVSRATLYLHFTSKASVADEIAQSLNPLMLPILRKLTETPLTQPGLEYWLGEVLTGLRSIGPVAGVVGEAIGNNHELATSLLASMRETSADLMVQLHGRTPRSARLEVGSLAMLLTATTQLAGTIFGPQPRPDEGQLKRELAHLWLCVLT